MSRELVNKTVDVDFVNLGEFVRTTANSLELAEDFPVELAGEVFRRLEAVAGSLAWWAGDFFRQITNLKGSEVARRMMDEWDIKYSRAALYRQVCESIEPANRLPDLTFTHHEQALVVSESVSDALDLLEVASANSLSVAKMRQYAAGRGKLPPRPKGVPGLAQIYEVMKVVEGLKRKPLDAATRQQLKSDLKPMVEWYATL